MSPIFYSLQGTSILDANLIRQLIERGLPDAEVHVHGPDGVHFEARVVSAAFAGQRPLARHKLVYATLGDKMGGEIHALALTTLTPEERAREQQAAGERR